MIENSWSLYSHNNSLKLKIFFLFESTSGYSSLNTFHSTAWEKGRIWIFSKSSWVDDGCLFREWTQSLWWVVYMGRVWRVWIQVQSEGHSHLIFPDLFFQRLEISILRSVQNWSIWVSKSRWKINWGFVEDAGFDESSFL